MSISLCVYFYLLCVFLKHGHNRAVDHWLQVSRECDMIYCFRQCHLQTQGNPLQSVKPHLSKSLPLQLPQETGKSFHLRLSRHLSFVPSAVLLLNSKRKHLYFHYPLPLLIIYLFHEYFSSFILCNLQYALQYYVLILEFPFNPPMSLIALRCLCGSTLPWRQRSTRGSNRRE